MTLICISIFALLWGNLLNLCISYFPEEKRKVFFKNHYSKYGSNKPWYTNIPIFTYFYLWKKYGSEKKIPLRYLFVELSTFALLPAFFYISNSMDKVILWPFLLFFFSSLIIATFVDLKHWIIPDKITLPGIIIGFLYSFFQEYITWYSSLLGILIGGGILYLIGIIYIKWKNIEGIGGGDVKFLAMGGAFLGVTNTILSLIISSLTGAIIGAILIIIKKKSPSELAIPFGPFLALGMFISFLWGDSIWDWYTHGAMIKQY